MIAGSGLRITLFDQLLLRLRNAVLLPFRDLQIAYDAGLARAAVEKVQAEALPSVSGQH